MSNKFFKKPSFFIVLYMYNVYGLTPVAIYKEDTIDTLIQINKDDKNVIIKRQNGSFNMAVNEDNEVVSILSDSGELYRFKYIYNRLGQLVRIGISSLDEKVYVNFKYEDKYITSVNASNGFDYMNCQFEMDNDKPLRQPTIVMIDDEKMAITDSDNATLGSISRYEKLFKWDDTRIFFVDRKKMGSIAWKILQRKYKKILQEI